MSKDILPIEDQETIITFDRTQETANVYTTDKTMMKILDNCCKKAPNNYMLIETGKIHNCILDKEYLIKDKGLLIFSLKRIKENI